MNADGMGDEIVADLQRSEEAILARWHLVQMAREKIEEHKDAT